MRSRYILAGDIGGTKTLLALVALNSYRKRGVSFLHSRKYNSDSYRSLEELLSSFMTELSVPPGKTIASIAIAGVVQSGRCDVTNLAWSAEEGAIKSKTGLAGVHLMNDFTAVSFGVPHLKEEELETLNSAESDPHGHIATIGAGTGLGESLAFWSETKERLRVFQSEGGHTSFAPQNYEEIELLKYLWDKYGHVSFERLLSGEGLANIYTFLASSEPDKENKSISSEMDEGDAGALISKYGLHGKDELCARALDMFVSIYGSEAGNMALKIMPTGGLYIAGGIAPKIINKIQNGLFMKAFLDKGRMSKLLEGIPVRVIMNPEVGLIGSAARGFQIARS